MYENITPKGSDIRFADLVIEKAEQASAKRRFYNSPIMAAGVAAVIIAGAVLVYMNTSWLQPPDDSGITDNPDISDNPDVIHVHTEPAWKAFDGLMENAQALRDIAVIPEYEIISNNFDGLDIELTAMMTDGYGSYYFALSFTASGFDYEQEQHYYLAAPRINYMMTDYQHISDVIFDENGKAKTLAYTYNPRLLNYDYEKFTIEFTEIWCHDGDAIRLDGGGVTFKVKAEFPPCPEMTMRADPFILEDEQLIISSITMSSLGIKVDYRITNDTDWDNLYVLGTHNPYLLEITTNDGEIYTIWKYEPNERYTFIDYMGIYYYRLENGLRQDYFIFKDPIDLDKVTSVNIYSQYVKHVPFDPSGFPLEGGIPVIPDDLTTAEQEMLQIVKDLHSLFGYVEYEVLTDPDNVKFSWFLLIRLLNDEDWLTAEEMFEAGLIPEEHMQYYENYSDTIRISGMEKAFNSIISKDAVGITLDPHYGGKVIGDNDEYCQVWIGGVYNRTVLILTDRRINDDGTITMTYATGVFATDTSDFSAYPYFRNLNFEYNNPVGYVFVDEDNLNNNEYFVYPDRLDEMVKIDYTFIIEDGRYKIIKIEQA